MNRWEIRSKTISYSNSAEFAELFDGYEVTNGLGTSYLTERLDDAQKLLDLLNLHAR